MHLTTNGKGDAEVQLKNFVAKNNGISTLSPTECLQVAIGVLFRKNKPIAFSGTLNPSLMSQGMYHLKFSSEKECKEQMDKLNDPRYRWILKVLSPNNRDLLRRPEELPESFDACNFTEEEIKELRAYYEKKN